MTKQHAARRRRLRDCLDQTRSLVVALLDDDQDSVFLELVEDDLRRLLRRWQRNHTASYVQVHRLIKRAKQHTA